MAVRTRLTTGALLAAVLAACGAPPPDSPSAVVESDPEVLCMGDDFRTPIVLDARSSTPRLTLIPVPPDPDASPLSYEWALTGAAHIVIEGSLDSAILTVLSEGDRPLHAEMTVRDDVGGIATTFHTIPVTVPDPVTGECPEEPAP